MKTFKVGDTVRLKSGGPLMTVKTETADGEVACVWFTGKQEPTAICEAILPEDTLQGAKPGEF